MTMDRSSSGRFQELDVLRGVAALAVVFFHYTRHGTRYFQDYPIDVWIGKYGVHLFFVISGFVIFYTLEKSRTVLDFGFSRFSRLYPTYWAALGILAVWMAIAQGPAFWWKGFVVNATMLQKFVGFPDVDDVYWTLGIELAFYALMTVIFAARQMRHIVIIACVWLVASGIWGSIHYYTGPDERSLATTWFILAYTPYFMAGIMFYLIHSRSFRTVYGGVIALALVAAFVIHGMTVGWITLGIFALVAAAVSGWLRVFVNPVTLWLGAISYPLYLIHRLPGYALLDWLNSLRVPHWVALAIAVPSALLAGTVLSWLVERPAMRGLRRWYRGRLNSEQVAPNLSRG
jgi:peptidoglycan/LPS O-acetylase OafA/YrhL